MSLYNMTQGVNEYSKVAIIMLHQPAPIAGKIEFGRLRDAFLEKSGDEYRVRVHTRNGGGNRESYAEVIATLRAHPWFSFDEDCDHDSTYADFVFVVPAEFANAVIEGYGDVWAKPVDHKARFEAVLDKLKV